MDGTDERRERAAEHGALNVGRDDLLSAIEAAHAHLEAVTARIEGREPAMPLPAGPRHGGWRRPYAGEERWPPTLAVAVAIVLQFVLPDRLALGPRWLLPALEALLAVGLLVANPRKINRRSQALRTASIAVIAITSVVNGWSSYQLIKELIGGTAGNSAGTLLATGAGIYVTNIIVFALWYWECDRGGPAARAHGEQPFPDLLFPQMTTRESAPASWRPTFADYLYVSYTNATAFSPTDTMPLSRWTKLLFLCQSAIALAVAAMVIARAVNIFK